jgi:serine/threonine protein phosphatase 1
MIFRLSNRSGSARSPVATAAAAPEGMRVYVIGDVHGRADLLDNLARQIEADLSGAPGKILTILLGDYIDRGPQSAEVVDRLCRGAFPTPILALRGNHEQTMLGAFEDDGVFDAWRTFGARETLASYRIDVSRLIRGQGYAEARAQLREKMPAAHREFLESLPTAHELGGYFFCHAGVRPGVPLARQADEDLIWIRDEFLDSTAFHGRLIVHGHTPVAEPDFRPNRINIDTGAFATGRLTCLALEGTSRRILST